MCGRPGRLAGPIDPFERDEDPTGLETHGAIGADMDRVALEKGFEACLLTDAEMHEGPRAWSKFPDPFPSWAVQSAPAVADA